MGIPDISEHFPAISHYFENDSYLVSSSESKMASLHIHTPLLYTAGIIWPPVCIGIVGARIARKNAQRTKLGLDDWLVLPALVL